MAIIKPATVSPGAPQQHRQPSRKGKKAWRKNVDVTEIQEGLAEVRDEMTAGGIISEKPSESLFALDTTGDVGIQRKVLKGSKPLRADEIIAQRSAVPAVSMKKRPGEGFTTDGILAPKRQRTSYVSHKELVRLRKIADGKNDETALVEVTEASFDPWDAQRDIKEQIQDPRFSFLELEKKKSAPKSIKQKPISLAASGKDIPAVKQPDGGYSYNPVFTDYEQRLTAEGQKELEAEQKRQAVLEAEHLKAEAAAKSAVEAELAEAKAEMSEWEEDDTEWEGFESGTEDVRLNAKRPERKTQVQRNKIKRRKEEERKAKMAADNKKKNEQVAHAKQLAAMVKEKEEARLLALVDANNDDDSSEGDDLELRRRKLGKIALPEKDLELVLPDELQESLRLLKPEGNLLKDRYRSLLVRGKVESRRPISFAKKARRKATEKWTHKDFMLH